MRNLGKLAFRRLVLVSLGLLLQVGMMLLFFVWLADLRPWFQAFMLALRAVFVVHLVSARIDPSYKIAWLILILALPVAGVSIYLFLGGNRLSRREKRKMVSMGLMMEQNLQEDPSVRAALADQSPAAEKQSRYLYSRAMVPLYRDTWTEYYPCGEDCFPRMLEELRKAKHYIFLEYFIIGEGKMWGEILQVLKEKAAQGVDVRLIYDDFGCIRHLPSGYPRLLQEFGISAKVFNPFVPVLSGRLNNRDHRKLMVIDGKAGFTGGINLSDEYINHKKRFGYWKDAGLFLRGGAVWSMTVQFLSMWNYISGTDADCRQYLPDVLPTVGAGFVQPFSDSPLERERVGQTVLLNLITRAEKSVYIMTPYLVLNESVTTALCNAAKSGVDVRIVTPGIPDKPYVYAMTRANYAALTAAGVRIYEYLPGFLHSKVFLVDGKTCVVGTVNLDYRSLYLHFENGVWLHGTEAVAAVAEDFESTFPQCREVTHTMAKNVPGYHRICRSVLHLFAPLM